MSNICKQTNAGRFRLLYDHYLQFPGYHGKKRGASLAHAWRRGPRTVFLPPSVFYHGTALDLCTIDEDIEESCQVRSASLDSTGVCFNEPLTAPRRLGE
jgi:hypothetical protein